MIGFTTYEDLSITVAPTLEEMLNALTATQKVNILQAYVDKLKPGQTKEIAPKETVIALYRVMEDIENWCKETVLSDTPPTTLTEIRDAVNALANDKYPGIFSITQINAVIGKVLLVSKKDANGDYIGTLADYVGYLT